MTTNHPAKFNDALIPIFAQVLIEHKCKNVFDPMAGTGKIVKVWDHDWNGDIYCNEIEPEWCDLGNGAWWSSHDAQRLPTQDNFFDAICTSPTYGNRMADHHNAMDNSKRMTYTHQLGRTLDPANTGKVQWGGRYRAMSRRILESSMRVLRPSGIFIINIKDHRRRGEIMPVSDWYYTTMRELGLFPLQVIIVNTPGMGFGANLQNRITHEDIFVFQKD